MNKIQGEYLIGTKHRLKELDRFVEILFEN